MSYYNQRGSVGPYDNYSEPRRNSDSFSDEQVGAKRKKPNRWNNRRRGGGNRGGGNRGGSNRPGPNRNVDVDMPLLFKQPTTPVNRSPRQNRSPAPRQSRSPAPRQSMSPAPSAGNLNSGSYRDNAYRQQQPLPPQPYFDARDMPPFVEPQHSGSSWQWEGYFKDCQNWQGKHQLAYYKSRCMALEFENQMLFDQIKTLINENCVFAMERGVAPSMQLADFPGQNIQRPNERSPRTSNTQVKNQGQAKKTEAANQKKNEEGLKKKEELEKEGPKIPMGVKRKEELEQLYGENAATIHKLETEIMLNYNRNCDAYKPGVWMTVPLNPETVVD